MYGRPEFTQVEVETMYDGHGPQLSLRTKYLEGYAT